MTVYSSLNLPILPFAKFPDAAFACFNSDDSPAEPSAENPPSKNLEPQDDNQFNALMSINNINPAQSSMSQKLEHMNSQIMSNSGLIG